MSMKKFISLLLACSLTLSLAACGSTSSSSGDSADGSTGSSGDGVSSGTGAEPTIMLQLGHLDPSAPTNAYQIFCESFKSNLYELSNGTMDVTIYGDAQLGGEIEMFEALSIGDLDMCIVTNNYYSNFVKDFMVFDLPFLFTSYEEEDSVVDDPEILGYLQEQVYSQYGVHLLTYADTGFRYVVNNSRPIYSVKDFQGLKIRLPETTLYVKTFEALGANPTTMAFSEAYTAVQQGTVDGLEITCSAIYSGAFYEICKYLSKTAHFASPITLNMSDATWQTLTSEQQEIVLEAAQKARDESRVTIRNNVDTMLDEMAEAGCQINEIDDVAEFQEATAPVIDWIRTEVGDELLDMVLAKLGR